jgi:nucleotide-binding universal stress UspA family protein
VSKGSVVNTVLDYGEEQNIDLIVVGTKRQVWYYKNAAWNVASGLVTCALCPFLVIKCIYKYRQSARSRVR